RFQMREHLSFYNVDELSVIVQRSADKLDVEIEDSATVEIARRSRGTPRLANNRLRWVRDYVTSRADGIITRVLADEALVMQGIDVAGLDSQDRQYLETILRVFHGGPVGAAAVAYTMNAPVDTLIDEVEPFLLRTELVIRTPRGRKLTDAGYQHLGVNPPVESEDAAV
ncbi:MAG: Holliday junction branch migration DNA helicase RuvB, partial [Planctomycetales bacterium]